MALPGESASPLDAGKEGKRQLFPLSLRTHLTLISIILATGPVLIFGLFQAYTIRATQIKSLQSQYQTTAASTAREIDFFISDATDNMQVLAGAIAEMRRLQAKDLEAHLQRALDTRTIDHIAVMSASARSIVNVRRTGRLPVGRNYSDRPYIRALIASRAPQLSPPLLGRVTGQPEVFLAVPVSDRRGALKAILVGALDMGELRQRHLSEFAKIEPQSRILLLDATGRPVVTSDRTLQEVFTASRDARITTQSREDDPRLQAWTDEQGQQMVGARATLETWKWTILSGIPEEHLREAMATPIRRLGYATLWLLLACAVVSPFVARVVSAPILALKRQAKRIADGALGEQVSLAPYPPRELVELSNNLNTMSAQLAHEYREAQDRVRETETLLAVGHAVSSTLDLQEALRRGARELAQAIHADTAGAYLVSPDGQELHPFAGYHLPKEKLEYLRTTAIPIHWNGFVQEAFSTRRAIFSSDCQIDPRFNERVKLFSVRGVVMVPFFAKEEVTGCLFGIWWDHPHTPTSRELELAEGIGRQLALAVENSRLHKESLDRAEALAQSEDRYRRLAEGTMDLIFTVDVKGRFTYLNPHTEKIFGYRPEELLGQSSIALATPEYHDLLREIFAKALRGESGFDVYEVDAIKKDGSIIPLEVGASTIYDTEGRVIGRQGIARDLTERRRLEEAVRERKRLEEINQFKSQFLANMSHELRTPLNSVIGFSEILQDPRFGPLTGRQARFVNNILLSGRHLLALIEDILDLAKIEAGKMRLNLIPFEVRVAVEEVCGIIQHQADDKQQSVTIEVDPATGFCIADHHRLHQILLNLLHNAIKFTPDGGRITVSARRGSRVERLGSSDDSPRDTKPYTLYPGEVIEIAVADTGIGLSPDDLPRLFREFEQLEPFDTKNHEGTGLGLALCKRLVELHGGRIWASSEGEGCGSTFTFTIPSAPNTDAPGHA